MQKKEAIIYPLFSLPLMAMSLDIDNDKPLNATHAWEYVWNETNQSWDLTDHKA